MLSFSGSLKSIRGGGAVRPAQRLQRAGGLVTDARWAKTRGRERCLLLATGVIRGSRFYTGTGPGLWVLTKRLEEGTFSWPRDLEAGRSKLF